MGWWSNLEGRERWEKILGMGILRGPVVRTPCFHCRRLGFDPWWGNLDPASHKGVIMESLSLALPLLCQLGLQFPVYMGWESSMGGVDKSRVSDQGKVHCTSNCLQQGVCVTLRVCVCMCACVWICTLHLYASHSGRRGGGRKREWETDIRGREKEYNVRSWEEGNREEYSAKKSKP